jgi:hypothetical protein
MKRRITQITLIILGILIGALTNVATGVQRLAIVEPHGD